MLRSLTALIFCFLLPATGTAQVEVVLERKPTRATVYLLTPIDLIEPVFGVKPAEDPVAAIDLNAIVSAFGFRTEEGPLDLHPVSHVLHPSQDSLSFDAPWDASTAVQFGGVEALDPAEDYTLYARFEISNLDAWQSMTLFFPQSQRPDASLVVREFVRDQVFDRHQRAFDESAVVAFEDVQPNPAGRLWTIGFGLAFLGVLGFDWFRRRRLSDLNKSS